MATATSPQSTFVVSYEGYTITPSGHGSNLVGASNLARHDDVDVSHYKDDFTYPISG